MIPAYARSDIQSRLLRAEQEHNVKVLLAVESDRSWQCAGWNAIVRQPR